MLDRLKPKEGARRRAKRVGRGPGSGLHKTSGRGQKGQGKRSPGRETPLHFEGGQMPLTRRIPKRGFHQHRRRQVAAINVGALKVFGEGATVDAEALRGRGLIRRTGVPIKLLGEGDAPRKLTVKVQSASAGARQKVEAGGGTVEIVA